ncbi:MAG: antitoxin [Gracilibacteraceae bacterium]|nr:antitoxin [Gracilibacteraceae bacterium]
MKMTKVFNNGNSQAVRIPVEYRITDDELLIQKVGSTLILLPKDDVWEVFQRGVDGFTDDFLSERRQPKPQDRALSRILESKKSLCIILTVWLSVHFQWI